MKIKIQKQESTVNEIKSILTRTFIIIVFIIVCLFLGILLFKYFDNAWIAYRYTPVLENDDFTKRTEIDQNYSATYKMQDIRYDNYLKITLSGNDVYKVLFSNDDDSDYIIINTTGYGDTKFLYYIPDNITEDGYDRIQVTPVSGDGNYWAEDVSTCNDPNPEDYPDCRIIDYEIKKLEITISDEGMQKIKEKRREALKLGILISEDSDYVDAVVSADGIKDKAELRLKGDWVHDHLAGDKWSFRIKLDSSCLWGMSKFSIQPPETRNGIGEYLIQEMYREQGGVSLRYEFADVVINGEYKGVYALEEFFDKRAVENSLKREGPIICLNEDFVWLSWAYYIGSHSYFSRANVEVFSQNKTLENDVLSGYAAYGTDCLNRFIDGNADASEIFDLDLYAKYLAVLDIFKSEHGNTWHNMRYYINPVTAKLEPIPFDELSFSASDGVSKKSDPIIEKLFENDEFDRLYVQSVEEILETYDTFLDGKAGDIGRISYILSRDGITADDYSVVLDEYHQYIKESLHQDSTIFEGSINEKGEIVITAQNLGFFNVDISKIAYDSVPLDVAVSNYGAITINSAALGLNRAVTNEDIAKIEVTYKLYDGREYTKSLLYNSFSFYIAGHIYGSPREKGTPEETKIFVPFSEALLQLSDDPSIQFGILTGDTVWLANDECYSNLVTDLEKTGKPYYIAPGNHCLNDGGAMFAKYIGQQQHQSFVYNNNLFILVTPGTNWGLDDDQIDFIKNAVAQNKGVYNIFVFSHQLMWLEMDDERFPGVTPNSWAGKDGESNFWSDVYTVFEDVSQDVYFIAGDVGVSVTSVVYENIDNGRYFIASGMGRGENDNYLVVDVDNEGNVRFNLVALGVGGPDEMGALEDY